MKTCDFCDGKYMYKGEHMDDSKAIEDKLICDDCFKNVFLDTYLRRFSWTAKETIYGEDLVPIEKGTQYTIRLMDGSETEFEPVSKAWFIRSTTYYGEREWLATTGIIDQLDEYKKYIDRYQEEFESKFNKDAYLKRGVNDEYF